MEKVEFKVERYLPVINCIFKAQNPSENVARCLNGTLPEVNYNYVKNCSTVKCFVKKLSLFYLLFFSVRVSIMFYDNTADAT